MALKKSKTSRNHCGPILLRGRFAVGWPNVVLSGISNPPNGKMLLIAKMLRVNGMPSRISRFLKKHLSPFF